MNEKTDELIKELCEGVEKTKPLHHPVWRLLPWIVLVFVYVGVFTVLGGVRPDINERLADVAFLYEITTMGVIAITAALAALWLCVPDLGGKNWVIAVPVTLGLNFAHWTLVKTYADGFHMPPFSVHHCMYEGVELFFVPAAALMFITYRGATCHPYMMAFMNIIASCAVSFIGLRFTCMMDEVGHSFLYHILPLVLTGTAIGALARRIFKW